MHGLWMRIRDEMRGLDYLKSHAVHSLECKVATLRHTEALQVPVTEGEVRVHAASLCCISEHLDTQGIVPRQRAAGQTRECQHGQLECGLAEGYQSRLDIFVVGEGELCRLHQWKWKWKCWHGCLSEVRQSIYQDLFTCHARPISMPRS